MQTLDELRHYGVKGMRKGVRKPGMPDTIRPAKKSDSIKPATSSSRTVTDQSAAAKAAQKPAGKISFSFGMSLFKNPSPETKKRVNAGSSFASSYLSKNNGPVSHYRSK